MDNENHHENKFTLAGSNLIRGRDFYLLNCDTAGNPKWIIKQTAEGLGSELAYSLAADLQGNITLVGTFGSHDPIVFGGDQLNPTGNSFDIFTARLGKPLTGTINYNTNAVYILRTHVSQSSLDSSFHFLFYIRK